ncbi:MAG: HEAT repeat domain-containing protein [Elusimicrobia bacterium]|nr:HEAT repeat domain-containing protein [Candidatus Liberimonas magnetica]
MLNKSSKIIVFSVLNILLVSNVMAKKNIYNDAAIILQSGLTDQNREVRLLSIGMLPNIGKECIPTLIKLLDDESDFIKVEAARSLFKLENRSGIPVLREILANKPKLSEKIDVAARMKAITQGTVRVKAAIALGEIKDIGSVPLLTKTLDDDDGRVVDACLLSLAKLGDRKAKDDFASALKSTKPQVREVAAQALGNIGDPSYIPKIRERLKDWSRDVKAASITALAKLNDKESFYAIKGLLKDEDIIVRQKAVAALGMLGNKGAVDSLENMLEDPNGLVRISAAEALCLLGDGNGKSYLLKILKSDSKDGKSEVLDSLEKIITIKDVKILDTFLDDSDRSIAVKAANLIIIAEEKEKIDR